MKLVVHCASGKINGGGNSKGSCQGDEENRLMSWRGAGSSGRTVFLLG